MSQSRTLRAGVFLPPLHPNDEDPLLCMERDFQLMRWLHAHNCLEAYTIPAPQCAIGTTRRRSRW